MSIFAARNLTSNAGLFLLLENGRVNGIFDLINSGLVFDRSSTNQIKMNHIKTMLCGHYIGIDRLKRIILLQGDPLIETFEISVKEYPTFASQVTGSSVSFSRGEEGRETTALFTKLDTWDKDKRFVV